MTEAGLKVETAVQMRALGERLAGLLRAGDLVVLTGEIGAGKTTLVQGIGAGLGVRAPIVSPTFVISRVHRDGRVPLVHVVAYRLGSDVEVDDLDLDADLESAVTVVEWGEGLVERLSADRLAVRISRQTGEIDGDIDGDDVRQVWLSGIGPRWAGVELG